MNDELRARNELRHALLRALYDRVNSSVTEFVSAFEVGSGMGLDRAESRRVVEYLAEKGLLKVDDYQSGMVRLTAEGVDRVELG